jgi:mRNA interferase MazF
MEDITRGQIYWIKPSEYREAIGHVQMADRPGIVVSNYNNYTVEVVYLTTKPKKDLPTHCTIRSSSKVSTALCEQIQTVSTEQIGKYLGTATVQEMEAVERCMMTSLGLDVPPRREATIEAPRTDENLKIELIKAKHEAEIMKRLYKELLEETMNK